MALGKSIANIFTGKLQKLFGKLFSGNNRPTLSADGDGCFWYKNNSNDTYFLFRKGASDYRAAQLNVTSFSSSSSSVSSSSSSSSSSTSSSFSCSYDMFDISANLLAHYKMNDNLANKIVVDTTGNHNGESLRNTSLMSAAGKIGTSLTFNATTDKIDTGSNFIGVSALTISAWIYPTGYGENNKGAIVNNIKLRLWIDPTNDAIYFTSNGNLVQLKVENVIPLTTWTKVDVTRDAAGAGEIYINSVLEGSGGTGTPTSESTSNVIIGNANSGARTFDGRIDDVRIYGTVLTGNVIRAIYNQGEGTENESGCASSSFSSSFSSSSSSSF